MIRNLFIIAISGLIVAAISLAAAFSLGGRDFVEEWPPWRVEWEGDGSPAREGVRWEGPVTTREFTWSGAESLEFRLPAEIRFTQGPDPKLVVRGPSGAVEGVEVDGGEIRLPGWTRSRGGRDSEHLRIEVVSPDVRAFTLFVGELTIENYDQESLEISLNGAGQVTARGRATDVDVELRGAGEVDLSGLVNDNAKLELSGAGSIIAAPKVDADVSIRGIGGVELLTRPQRLNRDVRGLGNVDVHDGPPTVRPPAPPAPAAPPPPDRPRPPQAPPQG